MSANKLSQQYATKADIDGLQVSIDNLEISQDDFKKEVNERLDDHSERLGRMEDLLIEINRKL